MRKKRINMKIFREIMRLYETSGLSKRQIAKAVNVSRPVVSDTIEKMRSLGMRYDEIRELSDSDVHTLLCEEPSPISGKAESLQKQFPYFAKELKKKELPDNYSGKSILKTTPMVSVIPNSVFISKSGKRTQRYQCTLTIKPARKCL